MQILRTPEEIREAKELLEWGIREIGIHLGMDQDIKALLQMRTAAGALSFISWLTGEKIHRIEAMDTALQILRDERAERAREDLERSLKSNHGDS